MVACASVSLQDGPLGSTISQLAGTTATSHPTLAKTDVQSSPAPLSCGVPTQGTRSISMVALRREDDTKPICSVPTIAPPRLRTAPTKHRSGDGNSSGSGKSSGGGGSSGGG